MRTVNNSGSWVERKTGDFWVWLRRKRSSTWEWAQILAIVSLPAAWVTHVVWVIVKMASDEGAAFSQVMLGFLGAIIFPTGIIHGYVIWVQAMMAWLK